MNKHVDGYLIGDLEKIDKIRLKKNEQYGAAGYAQVITLCAGIELLGSLSSGKQKRNAFLFYWNKYLKGVSLKYDNEMGNVVYELVRHGIAHTYLTKTGIFISKYIDHASRHLEYNNSDVQPWLFLHASQFFKDFKQSYKIFRANAAEVATSTLLQTNLDKILKNHGLKSKTVFKNSLDPKGSSASSTISYTSLASTTTVSGDQLIPMNSNNN